MDPEAEAAVLAEVAALHAAGTPVVLVHGGGPEIDRWLALRGVQTRRIDGLRVTDETTLEVTEAVLCATINKRLVRDLLRRGAPAAGISGEDAGTLRSHVARGSGGEDLGFVGEVPTCDPTLLRALLEGGYLPVVAPLAVSADGRHALNVNADLAAASLAGALQARAFIILTNVERVRRDPQDPASGIDVMTLEQARAFEDSAACTGGMRPKIQAAVASVERGAAHAVICAAAPGAIAAARDGAGTRIESGSGGGAL